MTQSLAEWLLVLAAILLPLDVALRRLVIGREGLVPMGTGPARVGQAGVRAEKPKAKKAKFKKAKTDNDGKPPSGSPSPPAAEEEEPVLATKLLERLRR